MKLPLAITDLIFLITLLFFFASGWRKGFWRTILGPIALGLAAMLSMYYYNQTKNVIWALLIGILGPFVIKFIFAVFLRLWNFSEPKERKINPLGSFLGGCLQVAWCWTIITLILFLIAVIPGEFAWLKSIKQDINASKSYAFIYRNINHLTQNKTSPTK